MVMVALVAFCGGGTVGLCLGLIVASRSNYMRGVRDAVSSVRDVLPVDERIQRAIRGVARDLEGRQ